MSVVDKLPVREVMSRPPAVAEPGLTVAEAAGLMDEMDVGGVVVVEAGAPVGIVTERDVVRKVVATGRSPEGVSLGEVMTAPLVTVRPATDVAEVARTMAKHRVRRLPIVDGGRLVGIVTDRDLLAISPALFDIARDGAAGARVAGEGAAADTFEGTCEGCLAVSDELRLVDGAVLCGDCVDDRA